MFSDTAAQVKHIIGCHPSRSRMPLPRANRRRPGPLPTTTRPSTLSDATLHTGDSMNFAFTPEQNAFRADLRTFLRQELGPDFHGDGFDIDKDRGFERQFVKRLAAKGWLTAAWPKEYGGLGLNVIEQAILNEELHYHRSPHYALTVAGVELAGPILMVYGTDEQKSEHLPLIASGERVWAQGFSEPNAGSDLASAQLKATIDGDDFVLNGTKIWTSFAHVADWIFVLARTDPDAPKHKGLSFILADMKQPGVTVQPLIDMAGEHVINQEYFEDVRVPRANLVGELNRGWYVAAATLDFERTGIAWYARARRRLDDLAAYCKTASRYGRRLIETPWIRNRLVERRIELEVSRYISYRVAFMQSQGLIPNQEASMAKLFNTDAGQRVVRDGVDILGLDGQRMGAVAPLHGEMPLYYLNTLPDSIESGSNEIQRNIIATRGLGLPRV